MLAKMIIVRTIRIQTADGQSFNFWYLPIMIKLSRKAAVTFLQWDDALVFYRCLAKQIDYCVWLWKSKTKNSRSLAMCCCGNLITIPADPFSSAGKHFQFNPSTSSYDPQNCTQDIATYLTTLRSLQIRNFLSFVIVSKPPKLAQTSSPWPFQPPP